MEEQILNTSSQIVFPSLGYIIKQKLKVFSCSLSKKKKVIYLFIISHEGCFGIVFQ